MHSGGDKQLAHYHFTVRARSRRNGRSTVDVLAYCSATDLLDLRNGEVYRYAAKKGANVFHVDMLLPEGAPQWIVEIAHECQPDRQSALQKFSDIIEAAERRKDSRVYREVEFALPNELTNEQNVAWADTFVKDFFVAKGMVAIVNYHLDVDEKTGTLKPHCHVLLSTRDLTEDGFRRCKNLAWNSKGLVVDAREQFAAYQNAALKVHGFEARVDHRSLEEQGLFNIIDPQPKLGCNVREMIQRGLQTDRQKIFDAVRLKNQFKILKNPDLVFSIVTANHATFTRKDIAKVLNRYVDDPDQFRILLDRLMASEQLVNLESARHRSGEAIYTTRSMLRVEQNLVRQAEFLSAQNTHPVSSEIVEKVIANYNKKLEEHGGLSFDQQAAIRHMLSASQISCVVGFAGAGKTTCLEAVREAWEEAGYRVLGLAPTGRGQQNIEACGIRSMTIHKFLWAQKQGREPLSSRTIVVGDEFGMVDSRRCSALLSLVEAAGAKIVPMGDGAQAQSIEAGPAFRLLGSRVSSAVLEKVVRQKEEWQQEATRLFGAGNAFEALELYREHGCITLVTEKEPDLGNRDALVDHFCLARQLSGRIWQEMAEDFGCAFGKDDGFDAGKDFALMAKHQDFGVFQRWKKVRQSLAQSLVEDYGNQREALKAKGADVNALDALVRTYTASPSDPAVFGRIETVLRQMSYGNIVDTRANARQAMVEAWAEDMKAHPEGTHLMLAFTNRDAIRLNEAARTLMRQQGKIQGRDFTVATQSVEVDDFGVERTHHHERTFAKGDRLLFTRNNTSLKVKNGSLGTILSIDRHKLVVRLDDLGGDEGKTVSFSPNLYPFIDNGWATTIIKAQGATAHHVKVLGSFELYRNMAYVAMSRHRHTLKLFGSTLDFWREEKIIDRLSRVQEKLSGFDYLDADTIEEKLAEDTAILWHVRKMQQARDFWTALKVTARDVTETIFGTPETQALDREAKDQDFRREIREEFLSFEDTEEVRSRDFFEALDGGCWKGGVDGKKAGKKEEERTPPKTEDPPSPKAPREQAREQASQSPNHPEQDSKPFTDPISSPDAFAERLKAVQEKINRDYDTKVVVREKFVSSKEVEERLKENIYELATFLFGEPNRHSRNSDYLRFGKLNEISIGVRGKRQGVYTNFESGGKGTGPLGMIGEHFGYSRANAKTWALEWLGGNQPLVERKVVARQPEKPEPTWKPITPVPSTVGMPDVLGNKYLNGLFKDGSKPANFHAYRNAQGDLLGYAVRIEKPAVIQADGSEKISKVVMPLGYGQNAKGFKYWKWQGFFEEGKKTPYGAEKLTQDPDKPVLVVEGEKTADSAQKALPHYHVLTWMGGAGSVGGTNWDCLTGKTVTIWPDYDDNQASQKAAQKLQNILTNLNRNAGAENRVGTVHMPAHWRTHPDFLLKDGWDLGDPLPKGWTWETVEGMARDAVRREEQREDGREVPFPLSPPKSQPTDSLVGKGEGFERERLPANQDWCAGLGFMVRHGRFPNKREELEEAWWQGERLTAIEGRLYREAFPKKKRVDLKELTLCARKELSQHQAVPGPILTFGRACDLTESQIGQLGQHALIHRDRTGQFPDPSGLEAICQTIRAHAEMAGGARAHEKAHGHGGRQGVPVSPAVSQPPQTQGARERSPEDAPTKTDYRALIEQQALLAHLSNRGVEAGREGETALKGISPGLPKPHDLQKSCSDRLRRMEKAVTSTQKFERDMKALDLSRQNQRGMDV